MYISVNISNIYCMCVYLWIHNKYTQYTYIYVNKNFYFGCDYLFDNTNLYIIIIYD